MEMKKKMTTLSNKELKESLTLFEFVPGKKASWAVLRRVLPDVETAAFFAAAVKMNYEALSNLLYTLFKSSVIDAFSSGAHSTQLQDYLVDTVPEDVYRVIAPQLSESTAPRAELLPEVWESFMVTIAESLSTVATKLGSVLHALPSKEGAMTFKHMAQLNRQRPTIGRYGAQIEHRAYPKALVVFDVSGSMTEQTVRAIVPEVVALAWKANASLAIVSNTTSVWDAGTYSVEDVLERAEYGGTQYETLFPLIDNESWDHVITIADYDSSYDAKRVLSKARGRIGKLFDVSLVGSPTYLAECLGQLASSVEPMLVARQGRFLNE